MSADEAVTTDPRGGRLRRHRRWWIAAAVVLLLVAVVGVVLWRELHFDARREAMPGTQFVLLVQPDVSPGEVAAVKAGLVAADRHLRTALGVGAERPIEVRLASSQGCQPFESPAGPPTALANAEQLCVNTRAPAWRSQFARNPVLAQTVVAHEHVHNVQDQVGCLQRPDQHEWLWLSEGMAVHLAFQSLVAAGRWPDSAAGAQIREWGVADPGLKPLAAYERGGADGDPAYALFHLATRYLDGLAPRPAAMMGFCRSVAGGSGWRDAFAEAFGLSVESFYARFEAARPELIAALPR